MMTSSATGKARAGDPSYRSRWVSFAKEPYTRDDILQKRPIILRTRTRLLMKSSATGKAGAGDPSYRSKHDVYGVATISRLLKIVGLFGRISSLS